MDQDALVVFPTAYGRNVCDCKRAKQHERRLAVYQHHQRSDCQSKITWIQVCVLARHKLWRQNFINNVRISRLHVAMKKIYNFPEKYELPKFILPVKISCFCCFCCCFFPTISRVELKNLQTSEQAHSLVSRLSRSISRSRLRRKHLCFNASLLGG